MNFYQRRASNIVHFFALSLLFGLYLFTPSLNDESLMQSTLTGKTILFVYALLVGFGILVFSIIGGWGKTISLKFSKMDLALFVFFIWLVINRYLFQSGYGFSLRFFDFLGLTVLYLMLRFVTAKGFMLVGLAIVISGVMQAIYGNLQLLGYYPSLHSGFGISGSYFNPGPYAGFLGAVWPMALGMYLFREKIVSIVLADRKKVPDLLLKIVNTIFYYVPIIGMATIIVVLPATRSRAAWLSVLVSTLFLAAYQYQWLKKIKTLAPIKKMAWAIVMPLLIGAGFYGIYHFKKGTVDGRVLIWKVTSNIIGENPLFGVGHDRFKAHYMDAQATYFQKKGETDEAMVADNTYYAFNEVLQLMAENGAVGLLLALGTLFFIIKSSPDHNKGFLKIMGMGTLLGIVVFGMFSYPAQILPIKMIAVFTLAMLVAIDARKMHIGLQKMSMLSRVMASLLCIMGIWYGQRYIGRLEQGYKGWKTAMDSYNYGLYEDSITEFEKVYPVLQNEGDFLMNYGKALVMAKQPKKAILLLTQAKKHLNTTIIETSLGDAHKALKYYSKAEAAYQHAGYMIPIRFYPQYLLAKLYQESGQEEKAVEKAREVLAKEVKVNSTAIKEIKVEMKKIINKKSPGV